MKVLALDIATSCGWAVVDEGRVVAAGTAQLDADVPTGKRAPPLDVRHVLLVQRLRESVGHLVAAHSPDVVAVEREFGRGAGSRLLVALYTAAQEAALVAELPCLGVRLGDWRKHIHGSAGWSTDRFKAAAVALVPEAHGDADAAEAALIARYVSDKAVVSIERAA